MNVLAVGCHPDDVELLCGGTVAKYARAGHNVYVTHLAIGDMGHDTMDPDELAALRMEEAREAARVLGAQYVPVRCCRDFEVDAGSREQQVALGKLIRKIRPDVVLAPCPTDYMRDHNEASALVFNATLAASVPHWHNPEGEPVIQSNTPIYYMDSVYGVDFVPQDYVDISDTIDIKLEAFYCHRSQMEGMKAIYGVDFAQTARIVAQYRGLQCGVAYAEAFARCKVWPRMVAGSRLP